MDNINAIINARGLARKLIDADPRNEGKSLQVPNLVSMRFDEYLENNKGLYQKLFGMNDKHIVKKALKFIHSSRENSKETAYREFEFKGDFSRFSFYDSCERILSRDEKIGNCVGLSSIVKYLLDTKGIESKFVGYPDHVALDTKIKGENIHLEPTSPYGFKYKEKNKARDNFEIISDIKLNIGAIFYEKGDFEKSLKVYNDAIKINPKDSEGYVNRANSLIALEKFEDALQDFAMAIKLNKNDDLAYLNRGITYVSLKQYNKALEDFEKYASFNEDNLLEVIEDITLLKKVVEE